MPSSATPGSRLIFRWPERSSSFLLPLFFLLAVAAHALTFYVFQIVYPPIVSIAPPPAQVMLLTPSNPQDEALLRWVEAQDPTAAPRLEALTPPALGQVVYAPSYAAAYTLPKPVEPSRGLVAFPSGYAVAPLVAAAAPAPRPAVAPAVTFTPPLRQRENASPLPPAPQGSALLPTVYLLAVTPEGEPRYLFLQSGCGDAALDRAAEAWLRGQTFAAHQDAGPYTWGLATFAWGARPPAPPEP